ncbi:MAG: glycosyltransferase, partial [Lutibacter sp.]
MLLSIITINFNNLEGLKKTMASVLGQTWKEFEYIIIDGGSTDGSAAYIESQSQHLNYWVSESDKGIYNAMNKGIKVAHGEYLLFLNSGDEFYDLEVLEKNNAAIHTEDFVYFDILLIFANKTKIHQY